jgi:hemerythrin-like metal-binding protein
MSLIDWTDGLAIGIGSIDAEHRDLISHFNDLHQCLEQCLPRPRLLDAGDALVKAIERHFRAEEKLLSHLRLPNGIDHCREHADRHAEFLLGAQDLRGRLADGQAPRLTLDRLALSLTEFELVRCDFEMVGHLLREGLAHPRDGDILTA